MKKFHFGHGIFIVLLLFIGFLVIVLIKSQQMNHTLVAEDYYAGDLAYQKTYEKIQNGITYKKDFQLEWRVDDKTHVLSFSDNNKKEGIIIFYRPSDPNLDFELPFKSDQQIEVPNIIKPGKWTITAEWTEGDKTFQVSKTMVIGV